jgi:PTH1 family peptidyl-tRNA hydrolase
MANRKSSKWPGVALLGRLTRSGRGRGQAPPDLIIVGIGNPGPKYAATRHNAGFWAIDELVGRHSIELSDRRRTCALGEGVIEQRGVVLAKPRTYVNESGRAARYLLDRYRVGPERLLVIYDDMDLPPGRLRLKAGGGPGGHNGMKSMVSAVGDRGFPRLRIGVGRPESGGDDVDYVLGPPSEAERQAIANGISTFPKVIAGILTDGMERTMDWVNQA